MPLCSKRLVFAVLASFQDKEVSGLGLRRMTDTALKNRTVRPKAGRMATLGLTPVADTNFRRCSFKMTELSIKRSAAPISAVGVISSLSKAPDDYFVIAQTTDGCDADLWKDGIFKSKVTRYLCFTRKTGPNVVVDMKLMEAKDVLPEGYTLVEETLDTKETAMRKRRLCVKTSPRAAAETALHDIQLIAKSKYHLVNYTTIGDINSLGLWYRMGDVAPLEPPAVSAEADVSAATIRRSKTSLSRPNYEQQNSGTYTMTVLLQLRHRAEHCRVTIQPARLHMLTSLLVTCSLLSLFCQKVLSFTTYCCK
ncbi:multivesicular body subunit 12B-like isoform X2 [Nelusetta ayraudi]|uniref:multivesicular body subunit 12B-like isoform X2 n=1 Tax=Nelusetta ayraudi TaxID=303726 RepID=UPI003F721769